MSINQRLKAARQKLYRSARAAAEAMGVPYGTYSGHENGARACGRDEVARYAKFFRVSPAWLEFGGPAKPITEVRLVGYVGAGAETILFGEGDGAQDTVQAPDGATEKTVAVEIRGTSLGSIFDRWIVYYDQVSDPPHSGLLRKLCVVGLEDKRILIKKLAKGSKKGFWTLLSNTEEPIMDVRVVWAAPVRQMTPRE